MRAVAAAIAGAYALAIMSFVSFLLPSNVVECTDGECVANPLEPQIASLGMTAVSLAVPTLLVLVSLVAVLGARGTRDPEAGAVLAALGQTRGTSVRIAATHGIRDGAIAVGSAFVIAGAIHMAMFAKNGINPVTTGASLWLTRALVALFVIGVLVLAHAMSAARRPKTPVDALTADMQDDAPPRPSLRHRTMLTGGALGLASGVIVALALWTSDDRVPDVSHYVTNAAGIAMIAAWASALALGLWVLVPWLRARRATVVGAIARFAGSDGRVSAVLGTYAGDRSQASTRIVTVLAGLGFLIGAVPSQAPTSALDDGLLSTVLIEGDVDGAALADRYRAVEGVEQVIVTEAALLASDTVHTFVYGVTPESVRDRDGDLADALDQHPRAVVASLWNGQAPTELLGETRFNVDEINPIATCCGAFVNTDHVELDSRGPGFLIFVTEDADEDVTSAEIDRVTASTPGISGWGGSTSASGSTSVWNDILNFALFAVVLGLPLTMLAVGAVRRRRRDDATLTALGATPRSVRTAITVEMAVVSAFALAGGAAAGAATRVLMSALQQARLSLGPVIVDNPVASGWGSVAWGVIAVVGIAGVGVMTVAAFLTAWVTLRRARLSSTVAKRSGGGRRVPLS